MPETAKILPMEAPRPAMGWQIEYEIYYGKKPKDHPEIDISISMEDSIHWFCRDHKFRVLSVHRDPKNSDPKNSKAPEPLFYRPFPDDNPNDDNPKFANHVNSGPARKIEAGYVYKPVFEFDDGTKLDPHIKTHP